MVMGKMKSYQGIFERELKENILKFWIDNAVDNENGGFFGYISNDLIVDKCHHKASILNSRILWTFSTAYRVYKEEKYLSMADRAYNFIVDKFIDGEYSGVYWMLDYKGNVANSKKQVYAIAFTIYGLSEYYRATGKTESLNKAIELFRVMEKYAYDKENKGYIEAFTHDWSYLEDMSLSEKDMNAKKSMNTHLHVLEAYTNLLRIWDSIELKIKLKELIEITIEHILDKQNYCFKLFFDQTWNPLSKAVSFGHDIEGSWLLYEAAEVLGDEKLLDKVREVAVRMASGVYERGIDRIYGGIFNEADPGFLTDECKDWWSQAEAVVGFFNAFQITKNENYLESSFEIMDFIDKCIVDKDKGEWLWGVSKDGKRGPKREKVGPWKCPYHNSRMCFEMISRLKALN